MTAKNRKHDPVGKIIDSRIRTVRVLGDRAKKQALAQGLSEDDIVVVTTIFDHPPRFEIEKIEGSPSQWIYDKTRRK